jgi:hypothetical protein
MDSFMRIASVELADGYPSGNTRDDGFETTTRAKKKSAVGAHGGRRGEREKVYTQ